MTEEDESSKQKGYGLERTLALSDGVFAFAITLLVLDLAVPALSAGATSADLWRALGEDYVAFLNFVLSFAIAGVWWNAHHRNFHFIRETNMPLRMLNLLFLVWIALLPFFTKLMTEYYSLQLSVVLYAVDQAATGFALTFLWLYVSRQPGILEKGISAKAVRRQLVRNVIVPLFFIASIGVSFLSTTAASFSWYLLFPIYVVLNRVEHRSAKKEAKAKAAAEPKK